MISTTTIFERIAPMHSSRKNTKRKPAEQRPITLLSTSQASVTPHPNDRWTWILLVLMVGGIIAVYGRTIHFDLTNWDDNTYLTDNRDLHPLSWKEVKAQAGRYVNGNWHPLTMLSYSTDLLIAGNDPHWSHGVGIALHVVNSLLAHLFLLVLTRSRFLAAGSALLFALHPSHVESVAWVSARKDLLFVLFGLLMLIAYVQYLRKKGRWLLWASFTFFLLSCTSKAMAVSLVPSLFLIDLYLQRSLKGSGAWLEKIPFIAAAIAVGLAAISAQRSMGSFIEVPLNIGERAILALANLSIYLGQQLVPVGMSGFHAYPTDGISGWYWMACGVTVLLLGYLVRSRVQGPVAFGLAFFTVNIALVLQFVPVGEALRAERYTYLAGVGSALALTATLSSALQRIPQAPRSALPSLVMLLGFCFVLVSHERCAVWRNSFSLWNDVLEHDPTMISGYLNRGGAYHAVGDLDRALKDYNMVLRLDPDHVAARSNRGLIHLQREEYEEASKAFALAAERSPQAPFMANASFALIRLGRFKEAMEYCDRAIELDPRMALAYGNRALCRIQLSDPKGALQDARQFLAMEPSNPLSEQVMVHAWLANGDTATACATLRRSTFTDAASTAERSRLLRSACGSDQ